MLKLIDEKFEDLEKKSQKQLMHKYSFEDEIKEWNERVDQILNSSHENVDDIFICLRKEKEINLKQSGLSFYNKINTLMFDVEESISDYLDRIEIE